MESLQTLMHQLERSSRWRASAPFRQLTAVWPAVVGESVAQHSKPYKIQRGLLSVSVSSAAWAQTLMFERPRILKKLHQQVPALQSEVRELRFITAHWQSAKRRSPLPSPSLRQHPSWTAGQSYADQPSPRTADAAFQDWARHVQARFANQSLCPECQRPCPTQELQRWPVCAICMTHYWHGR